MKKTIFTSLLTLFVTSAIIASTGFNTYATTDNGKRIQINNDGTFNYVQNINKETNPYLGTYYIGAATVNYYIESYLEKKGIEKNNSDYDFSYGIMEDLFKLDSNNINKIIGNFTYTLTSNKLIINEEDGSQIFEWKYEVIDNILYATVYGSDKMAIGKFIKDSKYLEVSSPELENNSKILLQRSFV
jgi:hypothetical protein